MLTVRRIIRKSSFLIPLLLILPGIAQDLGPGRLNLNERAYVAGKVYASAVQYFAHWADVPDLDLDAAYEPEILIS